MRIKYRVRRVAAGVLACILLLSAVSMSAAASGVMKRSTSRAIAIVFDNSGSMYMEQNKAWCRATYAIEVFASMMNEGDTLQVYPMYDVTVGGITYTSQNPFSISGGSDTSIIQTMYTPFAGDTPIETIGDAYNGLKKLDADERWLIVLTDGAVFYENGEELKGDATKQRLEEVLTAYNNDVNVLYLGIDPIAVIPEITGNSNYQYHTDKAADSRDTLTKLTEMCNMIFGRDVLANAGNKMTFDVSMKKLILFVQGSGISNVDLKDSSGKSVGKPSQSYSPRYGELGAGTVSKKGTPLSFSVDNSLSGYIAVYDTELDAGTYTMSFSGDVSSVSVYYEPNVDLAASLTDEYGAVMTAGSDLYPGTYTINFGLVDKDGKMTTSNLLGKINYTVTYLINGVEKTVKSDQNGKIDLQLAEGDTLDGKFSVTYLSGYTITKRPVDFNWPSLGFKIIPRPAGLLELKVTGGQDQYNLSELENVSYTVQLIYEGKPLTAEQMAAAKLSVAIEGGNVEYELVPNGDSYLLNLKYGGTAADTNCGSYAVKLSAAYTNEFGVESRSNEVQTAFALEDDGYGLEMEVDGDDYFVISKLDESEPFKVSVFADGKPLTDEQLANTALTVDGSGLTCESQPVPGESAFLVRIVKDANAKSGNYDFAFRAVSKDQVGREISAEDDMKVTLRTYPRWLPFLIVLLALLLIFALIWLYLSMKVLPKKIELDKSRSSFNVNGDEVNGTPGCSPTTFGKRNGTIQISTPKYLDDATLKATVTLNMTAVSPRRVKSRNRQALVTTVAASGAVVQKVSVGAHDLVKDDEGNWTFDGKQIPRSSATTNFTISGSPVCTIAGETPLGNEFLVRAQLKFK